MANTEAPGRTQAPASASFQAEQQQRVALRGQGLEKRGGEEVAHIRLEPKVMPETATQFKQRRENDKEKKKMDSTPA